jgi:hypothetical protein
MQKRLLKMHAVAKSRKEQESEMWRTFANESEMSVVEVEVVEEVVVLSIPGARALQGHLHDDENHRAVGHRQDETSTPTSRLEEAIEELLLGAGLVHDQFRVQFQGLLRDRGLRYHTVKRVSPTAGQDLLLIQGHRTLSERGCQVIPFHR